jgi:hypothetical protein
MLAMVQLNAQLQRICVSTLRTGYPHIQASSQDNDSRLPAKGSSEAAMCPRYSGFRSRLGAAPGPPRVTWAPAPTIWLMTAPELSRVLRTGSAGCKQINKYLLSTRPS